MDRVVQDLRFHLRTARAFSASGQTVVMRIAYLILPTAELSPHRSVPDGDSQPLLSDSRGIGDHADSARDESAVGHLRGGL